MTNKYANLVGTNQIKDEFTKITAGFAAVEVDTTANAANLTAHEAETVSDGVHGMGTAAAEDYEEGTWTPTIGGRSVEGTNTYTTQAGKYTRIGDLVTLQFEVELSAKDADMLGQAALNGFPFAASAIANPVVLPIRYENIDLGTGYTVMTGAFDAKNIFTLFSIMGQNQNDFLDAAAITDTSRVIGNITYRITE